LIWGLKIGYISLGETLCEMNHWRSFFNSEKWLFSLGRLNKQIHWEWSLIFIFWLQI